MSSNVRNKKSDQIFEITVSKAEEEKAAAVKKFHLKNKIMRRKLNVRIAASKPVATAAATEVIQALIKAETEKDNIMSEISFKVINISFYSTSLLEKKMV